MLIGLNLITAFASFKQASNRTFPDSQGYWLMAEGIGQGRFTAWYELEEYYPETLRTPGYPTFLLIIKTIHDSKDFVRYTQFMLYLIALYLALQILEKLTSDKPPKHIFLTLTAVNIQVPYYAGIISSEMLSVFLTILFIYILTCKPLTIKYGLLLGFVGACNFHSRPAFMLFPILVGIFLILYSKTNWKYSVLSLLVFFGILLHYGLWNKYHHDKFKFTPIEGGGGVAHTGYWSFKLPKGYSERYYWDNKMVSDWTDPFSFSVAERESNRNEFESEWNHIIEELGHIMTPKDSIIYKQMGSLNKGTFYTYRSEIPILREKLLVEALKENIKEDPIYYLKSRIYSFFRFYFSGINPDRLNQAKSLKNRIEILLPFTITFTFIALGMILSVLYGLKKLKRLKFEYFVMILMILYQGAVHIPFTIKSRYTIPVHILILVLLSYILYRLIAEYKVNQRVMSLTHKLGIKSKDKT